MFFVVAGAVFSMDEFGQIFCSVEKWVMLVNKLTSRQRMRFSGTKLEKMLLIPPVLMRKNSDRQIDREHY